MVTSFKLITKITLLVCLLSLSQCTSKVTNNAVKTGTIWLTCDDYVQIIKVNGVDVTLSGNVNSWSELKTINAPIGSGDTVSIQCANAGGIPTSGNPAALIATIRYVDSSGNTRYISTGNRFTCDGASPRYQGTNMNSNWYSSKGGPFPNIDDNANWIWNQGYERAICTVLIP